MLEDEELDTDALADAEALPLGTVVGGATGYELALGEGRVNGQFGSGLGGV